MWPIFFVAAFLTTAFLYVPGYLLLKGFSFDSDEAICHAPLVVVGIISVLSIVYGLLGIGSSASTLSIPILVLGILTFIFSLVIRSFGHTICNRGGCKPSVLFAYFLIGLTVALIVFVKNLDGPDSVFQAYDNFMHLGMVRSFLDSGNYSSFNSLYAQEDVSPFIFGTSFYPSAWHAIVAFVTSATNCSIPIAINAVNAVVVGLVFPGSMYLLLRNLFNNSKYVIALGAISSIMVVSFPWDFLAFGPLYPNLLSMALVPAACVAFMRLVDDLLFNGSKQTLIWMSLFLIECVAIALAHPSGIFIMAVFLAPFLINRTRRFLERKRGSEGNKTRVFQLILIIAVIAIWLCCYYSPFFKSVVEFNWPATTSVHQALIDVALLGMCSRPIQIIPVVLLLIGVLELKNNSELRWLLVPYLFSAFAYVLCVSTEGTLKHLVAGFWYTDPHRIAAITGLFAIPIMTMGMRSVFSHLTSCKELGLSTAFSVLVSRSSVRLPFFSMLVLLLALFPSFELRGVMHIETPFGQLEKEIEAQNSIEGNQVLTHEELEFSKRALASIPEDALIINEPNDGSAFLYSLIDANVYYRKFDLPSLEMETKDSQLLREALNEYGTSLPVKEAVDKIEAEYVLLLDQGEDDGENRSRFWSYYPEQWTGIESVNDSTPGFSVVLAEDDMRMYKIEQ